jgi:hypothetical protein
MPAIARMARSYRGAPRSQETTVPDEKAHAKRAFSLRWKAYSGNGAWRATWRSACS